MDSEERTNAIIMELEQQRNWALTRCVALQAEIAALRKSLQDKSAPAESVEQTEGHS